MANYYTLGAALPSLSLDARGSLRLTPGEFLADLRPQTSKKDQKLLELVLLKQDNDMLARMLEERPLPELPPLYYALGRPKLSKLINWAHEEKSGMSMPKEAKGQDAINLKEYPPYMVEIVEDYINETPEERAQKGFAADRLAAAYYEHQQEQGDKFIQVWSSTELAINAIFAAIAVRDYNLESKRYLIGNSELVKILRSGSWRELSHLKEADIINEVMQITEIKSIVERERSIDRLKWRILDSFTFSDFFSIDAMIAYLFRLEILYRWSLLDKEQGEKTFRGIISTLNEEGREELDTFRRQAAQRGAIKRDTKHNII